ncbi:MAG: CusA/CzcA family heavy metal efflux RND transporter [Candidatus Krumholzibacteria bacterium]|nr:CusA/CzcA family heavy metal efflux RND transporter [Candidatus Krumholzibacteria bacterium]
MDRKIVDISLRYRFLVLLGLAVVTAAGVRQYTRLPVDAFPDISPVMVPVFAEAHGMAPEEIERLIAVPIESKMNGLPGVTRIASTSAFGMAAVYVYFEDDTEIYFARRIVSERLADAAAELPDLHEQPKLGPISTGLGQIFIYYLELEPGSDTGGKEPGQYLREINDWIVKYRLQTVPGVTDILSIGGHVLQYQIRVDPRALARHGMSIGEVVEAVRRNNRNAGGQFMTLGREEHLVRGIGLVGDIEDIRSIHVRSVDGTPVRVGDVAEVAYGSEIRRGVVSLNGEREVVSGMVLQLIGENTSAVIERLYNILPEVQGSLPAGVRLVPYYEQAELVAEATGTVKRALLVGAVLVIATLALFLGNLRTALITALALPASALVSVLFMGAAGVSANLMSLGGIAVAIGMLGDGTIVMVENVHRRLNADVGDGETCRADIVLGAAREVSRPIVFSIAIIIAVFLPIFSLENVEGKMFSPMAFTLVFALLGSLAMAVLAAPALCTYLLRAGRHREFAVLRALQRWYRPALRRVLARRRRVIAAAVALLAASAAVLPLTGTEFIPVLEEGSILIGVTMTPSISLDEATRIVQGLERRIVGFGEVEEVVSRIGRPETGSHPHPVNYAEIHVSLKPRGEWKEHRSKEDLVTGLERALSVQPGLGLNFTQPIQNAFDELLTGIRAQVAVMVYGEDLAAIREKAEQIRRAIEDVPGLVDLAVEQSFGQPQVQVVADREACARYGVDVADVLEIVETAIGGEVIDQVWLGTRRFGIHARYRQEDREDPDAIGGLLVGAGEGAPVPLRQVASIAQVTGPLQIQREQGRRRWIVQGNVRGRDLGSVVADIRRAVDERIDLPPGTFVEYGGQFENQRRAMARLGVIVPIVIGIVYLLLSIAFGSMRKALLIFLTVPLALVGGVFGLLIAGEYLSVPAAVGFIALFGIGVQNGMVLVSGISRLRESGMPLETAIEEGAALRLRPVLMTATTTVLGVLPLLLSRGIGSEVQRPLAAVVVFGLITATAFTLFIIPAFYRYFEDRARADEVCEQA